MSQTTQDLLKYIPLAICAVIAIMGLMSGFVVGGISQYSIIRTWFVACLNFAFLVAGITMARLHINLIATRKRGWLGSLSFMIFFIASMVLGWTLGVQHPTYLSYFSLSYNAGTYGLLGTMGIFLIPMLFRAFLLRRRFAYYLAFVFIITMFATTAAGDFLSPTLTQIGRFVFDTFGANGEAGYNISRYLPQVTLFVAILLFRERSRPV